jgi:O-acetyl-ADP-ribose deacetylase (regulator of RNase III)
VIIELSSDSTKFRSTTIKSYYDDHVDLENSSLFISIIDFSIIASVSKSSIMSQSNDQFVASNQESESEILSNSSKRDRDRFRKYLASTAYLSFVFNTTVAFASISLFAVASKLDSIIHIALSQFAEFRQKEINDLIEKDVFQSVDKNEVSLDVRIFNSRFVDEIKHFDIDKAFEKSRLVMQTFNDQNKNLILIQSSIIQRISQRLIVCLIVVFSKMNLYLRDIIQTYVQSITSLNRDFFVRSFVELIKHLDIDTNSILKIIKSLYDVLEIDNH